MFRGFPRKCLRLIQRLFLYSRLDRFIVIGDFSVYSIVHTGITYTCCTQPTAYLCSITITKPPFSEFAHAALMKLKQSGVYSGEAVVTDVCSCLQIKLLKCAFSSFFVIN